MYSPHTLFPFRFLPFSDCSITTRSHHSLHFIKNEVNFHSNSAGYSWGFDNDFDLTIAIFQKLSRIDVSDGSWVVVAGDSQVRLFVVSLYLVLSSDEMELIQADLFKRQSDYHIVVEEIGMKLDFIWAPYVTNLTHFGTG
ncbi:hypothetical protein LXL04_031091 [Taraxacum kok-saghyz]